MPVRSSAVADESTVANGARRETAAAYEQYGPALLRYAWQIVGNQEEARDAVQEAFLRFFVERRYGRVIENPRAWLYHVLRNYLLDRLKANPARRELQKGDVGALAADKRENPEELLEQSQTAREIANALSDREYVCLTLRGEGLSYAEIAHVMSIRSGTVGALLARAHGKLKRYSDRYEKTGFRGIAKALLCLG